VRRRGFDPLASDSVLREPSADERARQSVVHLKDGRRRQRRNRRRRVLRRAVFPVAAVVALVAAGVVGFGRTGRGPAGFLGPRAEDATVLPPPTVPAPDTRAEPQTELIEPRHYLVGDCVDWEPGDGTLGQKPTTIVPCDHPHQLEVTGEGYIRNHDDSYPTRDESDRIEGELCSAGVVEFVGRPVDPYGPYPMTSLQPTRRGWEHGDRHVYCGFGSVDPGPDHDPATPPPGELRWTGSVKDKPAWWSFAPSTCLATAYIGATACRHEHELEVVGRIDLPPDAAVPAVDDRDGWSALVGPRCRSQANSFLGGALGPDQGWGWYPTLKPESVAAGTRTVFCVVGDFENDQWVTVTGSLREATS
jgi:hypothetical protein